MTTLTGRLPELADLVDRLPEDERRQLEDAFLRVLALSQRSRPAALPDEIPAAAPGDVATARAVNLKLAADVRKALVAESLSTGEVAMLLGITPAAVTKRRGKGELVAFRHGGDWRYPGWQFADDEPVSGVIRVWRSMPARSTIGRVRWFTLPSRHLDGATPLDLIDKGEVDRVVDAASYIGSR